MGRGGYVLVVRVEAADRKSFFAVAESPNGVDNFRFWERPITLPETGEPDTNVYDMRLTRHADGWIYGLFCTERRDPTAPEADQTSAVASCGIARTHDLLIWERLPDLQTNSASSANVVLHPEFVAGKYAFYTRPQDGFIDAGQGGGIGFALSESIENAGGYGGNAHRPQSLPHGVRGKKTASARPRLEPKKAGCTWPTACATPPPACATCSTYL